MTINQAEKKIWYSIENINSNDEDLQSRFYKLGLIPGARIMLKRRAPIFRDPILIQTEDSQIALTKHEATSVLIKQIGS